MIAVCLASRGPREHQANLEDPESQEPREHQAHLESHQLRPASQQPRRHASHAHRDHPAHQDHLVLLESLESLAHRDVPVLMLQMANLAPGDHPDLQESQDPKDHPESLECLPQLKRLFLASQESKETKVLLVPPAHLDHPVPMDHLAHQDRKENQDQMERQEPMVNPDPQDPLDLVARLERREFARNIVPSMAVSSSRTALGVNKQPNPLTYYHPPTSSMLSKNIQNNIFTNIGINIADAVAVLLLQFLAIAGLPLLFLLCFPSPFYPCHSFLLSLSKKFHK